MSQENVDVVRRNLESFEEDAGAWLETLDPDVRLYPLEEALVKVNNLEAIF